MYKGNEGIGFWDPRVLVWHTDIKKPSRDYGIWGCSIVGLRGGGRLFWFGGVYLFGSKVVSVGGATTTDWRFWFTQLEFANVWFFVVILGGESGRRGSGIALTIREKRTSHFTL